MSVSRRTLLQLAGAAALPRVASAGLPSPDWTAAAHARLATASRILRPEQRATLSAIADAILPRTDTPGALDVGTVDFVELLLAEWATPDERAATARGLDELEAAARTRHGRDWASLDATQRQAEIAWAEERGGSTDAQRAFRRLKSWTVHGWLTSERVQREVLRTRIVPGEYEGCAPVPLAPGGAN